MQDSAVAAPPRHTAPADYAVTVATTFTQIALALVVFHLVATRSGPSGFSYYALARNLLSVGQPIVGLGLVISVMRYLPTAHHEQSSLRVGVSLAQVVYLGAGLLLLLSVERLLALIAPARHEINLFPAYVALCGVALTSLASAMLRGVHRPALANVVMLLGLGVLPLLSFLVVQQVESMLILQGVLASGVAALTLLIPPAGDDARPRERLGRPSLRGLLRSVIGFGWRRVPGDAALPALYATPTLWLAHAGGTATQVSAVGFASSAALLGLAAFGLLTPVLLPLLSATPETYASRASRRRTFLRLQLVCAAAASAGCLLVVLLGGRIVAEFLGPEFSDTAAVLSIGVLTTIPMAAFYAARPLLETVTSRSITTRILLTAWVTQIATTIITTRLLEAVDGVVAGWIAGCVVAGALAVAAVSRWHRTEPAPT